MINSAYFTLSKSLKEIYLYFLDSLSFISIYFILEIFSYTSHKHLIFSQHFCFSIISFLFIKIFSKRKNSCDKPLSKCSFLHISHIFLLQFKQKISNFLSCLEHSETYLLNEIKF